MEAANLVGDDSSQRRDAGHRRILIAAVFEVPANPVGQCVGRIETRVALRKVDGVGVRGQLAHHREDGCPDARELAR